MTLRLYMDVHVPRAIVNGLRLRKVDVLTAQDDGSQRLPDDRLLDRAGELGRVLFSQDQDLLREAHLRQETGRWFAGVIFAHQLRIPIGQCVDDLDLLAKIAEPAELASQVEYLPLK